VSVSRLWPAVLVAVVGFQLRSVIVGVPPVLPEVRADLHLSFAAAGALSAIPVLGLGAAAVPGALLANRFGARRVVGLGTVGLGVAALLRLTPPVPAALFFWTAFMALSVAVVQPGIVVFVRATFSNLVQQASTAYATALGLGGLAGATLSIRLLAFGGWRGTFVIWGALALAAGLLWLATAPGRGGEHAPHPGGFGELVRDRAVWQVAAMFGSQSLVYYSSATWIPFEVRWAGTGYLTLVLFLLNAASIPLSVVLVMLRWPWARSRAVYAGAGLLMLAGSLGFALGAVSLAWLWASLLSVAVAVTFTGSTVLPALFSRRQSHTAGYASLVLTAGYALAFLGPLLGGLLVDRTHTFTSPFWLTTAAAVLVLVLGATLPRRGTPGEEPAAAPAARAGSQ